MYKTLYKMSIELKDKLISKLWEYKDNNVKCTHDYSIKDKQTQDIIYCNNVSYCFQNGELYSMCIEKSKDGDVISGENVNMKKAIEEYKKFLVFVENNEPCSLFYYFTEYDVSAIVRDNVVILSNIKILKYFPDMDIIYNGILIKKEQL